MLNNKDTKKAKALEGVKIANFAQAMAGAISVSYLASFGATAIKVESRTKLDWMRQSGPFMGNIQNPNNSVPYLYSNSGGQYGVTLNLKKEKGKELANRIVQWSDVIIENFAGGVMSRLGLGYEDLIEVKSDIILGVIKSVNAALGSCGGSSGNPVKCGMAERAVRVVP